MLKIKLRTTAQKNRNVPEKSGVYVFYKNNYPTYIGKAINLKLRLNSYFSNYAKGKPREIAESSDQFGYIITTGDFEALLLESNLIKKFKPQYNVSLKDDKSPLYIRITNDDYPQVLTARKNDLKKDDYFYFGPYPSSYKVYEILKILRRIYPFATHLPTRNPCLYSQLGYCDPCPSNIENSKYPEVKGKLKKEYLTNIKKIKNFLSGNIDFAKIELEGRMKYYILIEDFESAQEVKNKIDVISYITEPHFDIGEYLKNPEFTTDVRKSEKEELEGILKPYFGILNINRIECFDVAHLGGEYTTASMVTFIDGEPAKNYYRRFKIKKSKKSDDISSMHEVITRRIRHFTTWGKPDLILVDGGKAQVKVFHQLVGESIPTVGLAKRYETIFVPNVRDEKYFYEQYNLTTGNAKNLLQRIRNEAHRFARKYHHLLITRELLKN
jgi:excinuclease ABC subunit C